MSSQGAATPLLLAVAAFVALLAVGIGDVALLIGAQLQAAAAADAAALAAAPVTFDAFGARAGPAAEARRFAEANGARLLRCRCPVDRSWEPRTVVVEVARSVSVPGWGRVTVRAVSTAEFEPSRLLIDEGPREAGE